MKPGTPPLSSRKPFTCLLPARSLLSQPRPSLALCYPVADCAAGLGVLFPSLVLPPGCPVRLSTRRPLPAIAAPVSAVQRHATSTFFFLPSGAPDGRRRPAGHCGTAIRPCTFVQTPPVTPSLLPAGAPTPIDPLSLLCYASLALDQPAPSGPRLLPARQPPPVRPHRRPSGLRPRQTTRPALWPATSTAS